MTSLLELLIGTIIITISIIISMINRSSCSVGGSASSISVGSG